MNISEIGLGVVPMAVPQRPTVPTAPAAAGTSVATEAVVSAADKVSLSQQAQQILRESGASESRDASKSTTTDDANKAAATRAKEANQPQKAGATGANEEGCEKCQGPLSRDGLCSLCGHDASNPTAAASGAAGGAATSKAVRSSPGLAGDDPTGEGSTAQDLTSLLGSRPATRRR